MELPYLTPGENLRLELELKTPKEVADAFGVTETTLAQWRSKGEGPAYARLGKAIFYPTDSLHRWIAVRIFVPYAKPATVIRE